MNTILAIITALPSLIKTIIEIMKLAEEALGSSTGQQKKDTVMQTLQTIINNDELWSKVKTFFSNIINTIALFNFGSTGKDPGK